MRENTINKSKTQKNFKRFIGLALATLLAVQSFGLSKVNAAEEKATKKVASLKPKSVKPKMDDLKSWDPKADKFDYLNVSSVALKKREKGAPINNYASDKGKILSLMYLIGNNP